ncbi:phosphotransferase [Granulicella sibirica]|uniref:Aminoglycoside phosphotransferase domain-containing protein n=1 Tax=Granulicella sibirica TaxID=2479048 RepID=A0A4Q0SU80_9BACT|nr:phosphotransferase [Granulicella sibirica]RXH53882.1 hypothetical protein GRAN_5220 [Granulicella sibirica]
MPDFLTYRLALILPRPRALLVASIDGVFVLPQISISRWERVAQQLTRSIQENWGLGAILLDVVDEDCPDTPCAVVEVRNSLLSYSASLAAVDLDEINGQALKLTEREVIRSLLNGRNIGRGPFSRIGWLEDVQDWIRQCVTDQATYFDENVRQLNASGSFALVRFPMHAGPAYWLKATGTPNIHELYITVCLAQISPSFLPPLLGVRTEWNAWITQEAGYPLDDVPTLSNFKTAVRSLAELQMETLNCTDMLTRAGALDHCVPVLRSRVDQVMNYLMAVMPRQTSTRAPRLEEHRLRQLGIILRDAFDRLEALEIPDTLIHNDLNPGNILLDGCRCRFTDWAEAYVGNPFLSLQLFLVIAEKRAPNHEGEFWRKQLSEAYCDMWSKLLNGSQIARACSLIPLLSVYSCLHGRGDWFGSERSKTPPFEAYARCLARHMDRAAQSPEFLGALCR